MKCKGKKTDGKPCGMNALKGGRYCFTHSPETRAQQAQARKRGGENRYTPHAGDPATVSAQPRTVEEAYTILDYVLAETLAMDNGVQRNRLLVSIAQGYADIRRKDELETQLKEYARILAARKDN